MDSYGFNAHRIKNALTGNKSYIYTPALTNELFYPTYSSSSDTIYEIDIFQSINKLGEQNILSDFGKNILLDIANALKLNYEGSLSFEDLKSILQEKITEYNNHNYSTNSQEGILLGQILSISINSIEWWEQNQNNNQATAAFALPAWAAADIGGAIGGAAGSILSDVFNGEDIDWSDAAAWAIGGAVGASTGSWLLRFVR